MDAGDSSQAIRRARRAGAKQIDLSNRGLREWPEGLFSLRQLETLDVSGNELCFIDRGVSQLEMLETLNLSNNGFETMPDLDIASLPRLRSILLDGNPVASQASPGTLRQLARPPAIPGQTPAQVLSSLLQGQSPIDQSQNQGAILSSMPALPPECTSAVQDIPDFRSEQKMNLGKPFLSETQAAPWRKEQSAMLKEVEVLQAQVQDLEAQLSKRSEAASSSNEAGAALPAWMRQGTPSSAGCFSDSLGSQRVLRAEKDEAAELKEQLLDEQRKSKRLEQEVQRMSERLGGEQDRRTSQAGRTGTVPYFEFSEVELGEQISQGGFSVVHKGAWHTTKVAIKKLFDPKINEELLAEFDNEVQKLEQLRHPNILMLLAVHRKPPSLSFLTELVEGGSFYQFLHSPFSFNSALHGPSGIQSASFRESTEIMDYAGTAIAFLHARGIAHRDVKSQNVLLSPTLEVKLCDFGLARMRSELMTGTMQFAGTPNYMAPEIFRNQKYTENVDVFAYGTMLWEALAIDIPFVNLDPIDIKERVLEGRMLPMPSAATPPLQGVIQACWTGDRNLRPGMADALTQMREALKEPSAGTTRLRRPRTAQPVSHRAV